MKDSTQELASCVCNYAQVRGCWAVYLGLGFEARKEGREERRKKGEGEGGEKERSSEARENLVILCTAASLMDSVCVCVCAHAWCACWVGVCMCECTSEGEVGKASGFTALCLSNLFLAFTMW